jgi:hypothetical protein
MFFFAKVVKVPLKREAFDLSIDLPCHCGTLVLLLHFLSLTVSLFDRVAGHSWAVKKFFNVDVYRLDGKQE